MQYVLIILEFCMDPINIKKKKSQTPKNQTEQTKKKPQKNS